MTSTKEAKLKEMSLAIIAALLNGERPTSMKHSSSEIGIGDYVLFCASAINYLIKKGELQQYEKRESATFMINHFMQGFKNSILSSTELSDLLDVVQQQKTIEDNFAGIIVAVGLMQHQKNSNQQQTGGGGGGKGCASVILLIITLVTLLSTLILR